MIETVSTMPAIQWYVTHANWYPSLGMNAVYSSTSMAADMIQWKSRAARVCRGTLAGILLAISGATGAAWVFLTNSIAQIAWPIRNASPPIAATQIRKNEM